MPFTSIHPITPDGEKFLASLNERERKLHEIAMEKLGSSYFVERTHAFRKWLSAQQAEQKQKPTSPKQ